MLYPHVKAVAERGVAFGERECLELGEAHCGSDIDLRIFCCHASGHGLIDDSERVVASGHKQKYLFGAILGVFHDVDSVANFAAESQDTLFHWRASHDAHRASGEVELRLNGQLAGGIASLHKHLAVDIERLGEEIVISVMRCYRELRGDDVIYSIAQKLQSHTQRCHRVELELAVVPRSDKPDDIVIEAGTYAVSSIKTAEAVKIVENSQRDINIAFMNELAMVFDRMGIDTNEVVDGMNTKWNALGFRPGLVGGHCIGVDPYYFTYEAEKLGYHSQIILNGRIVNDSMGAYVADAAVKKMINVGQAPKNTKVVILGLTFKENCPDTRNSKVDDIIKRLNEYGIEPIVVDPWASERDAMNEYGVSLTKFEDVENAGCIIVAVAHNEFKALSLDSIKAMYDLSLKDNEKVLIDVKGLYSIKELKASGICYWRL